MVRNHLIFYRSFYEAIKDLPRDIQGEIYTAIMEYALNGNETDNLKPIARSIFILIKPQLDANNQKFKNGCEGAEYGKLGGRPRNNENPNETPKKPQENPNETPNNNDNDNDLKKENTIVFSKEKTDFENFNLWIAENAPYCANPKHLKQLTESEFLKLKEKYTSEHIGNTVLELENRKDHRKKYSNLYKTLQNWCKPKSEQTDVKPTKTVPYV